LTEIETNYPEQALGGVLPDRTDRMAMLVRVMVKEHWPPAMQEIFDLLRKYFILTSGMPTPVDWKNLLDRAGVEPAVKEAFLTLYQRCYKMPDIPDHVWAYSLEVMRDQRSRDMLLEALSEAAIVLTDGKANRKGEKVQGYNASRVLLQQRMGSIEQLMLDAGRTPEGDVMSESKAAFADYVDRKDRGIHEGVMTGLDTLDALSYGSQRGEFWLIAAYSGHGKTQTLTNIAWQAVVDGHNVVYFTLETLRAQVARRFHTRHSSHPKFGWSEGLLYDEIKSGSLSKADEKRFKKVLYDLAQTKEYGRFEVIWTPRGASPDSLRMKLEVLESVYPIDLVIVDYAGLMGPGKRVERRQEGLVEILQGLKGLATGHNRGVGVPVMSAYQMTRIKMEEARGSGGYTLDSLAETAEAERSADVVMSLMRQSDEDTEVHAQVLKYRDGQTASFYLETDFARSLVRDRDEAKKEFGGLL